MEYEGRSLPETKAGPPPSGRRMLKRSRSLFSLRGSKPKVAEKLASAKKWVVRVFKGRGEGEGQEEGEAEGEGGVVGEEGDGGEEEERGEERDVGPVPGQQMTSRGRMEGYF